MISKSIMIAVTGALGGNAAFIENGSIIITKIENGSITTLGRASVPGEVRLIDDDATMTFDLAAADEDDTELLGSASLAAGGRALANRATTRIALVKGSSGWVGVRA